MELGGMNLNDYFEENDIMIRISEMGEETFSDKREEFLTNIFLCAAKALKQFHEFSVHLDIKSKNFVLKKEQNLYEPLQLCKLIDFNSSIIIPKGEYRIAQNLAGNISLAPEVYEEQIANNGLKVNRKVDIWAFGVMMISMMNFRFQNIPRNLPLATGHIINNLLPTYLSNNSYNTQIDRVLKGCMQLNATFRPSISAIVNFLEGNCQRFRYEARRNILNICDDQN
uniref:Protein kinase domain-containing protein n=1 Tax=Meloidogyne hapla TaxID=6305 RepID=A0A1I8AX92_MELHA